MLRARLATIELPACTYLVGRMTTSAEIAAREPIEDVIEWDAPVAVVLAEEIAVHDPAKSCIFFNWFEGK